MFPKSSGNKGFFKRASSWRDKHSKQKSGNSGSTSESGLHKAISLNDVSLRPSRGSGVGAEPSPIETSFRNIQLDDAVPSAAATGSSRIFDNSYWYQPAPSSSKGTKRLLGPPTPRPTAMISPVFDDSQINNPSQDFRTMKSPVKPPVSSKACEDSPVPQNPFNPFVDMSLGEGSNLSKNPSSVWFSTENVSARSSQGQSPPSQVGNTLQADRSPIKSLASVRQSTGGGAVRTSPMKKVSPNSCIGCHGSLETPTSPQFGGSDRLQMSGRRSFRSTSESPFTLPRSPPGTLSIFNPGQHQTAAKPPKYPSGEHDRWNPNERSPSQKKTSPRDIARSSQKQHSASPSPTTSPKQISADPFLSVPESNYLETFEDYDVLADARRFLTSMVLDVNQSLDAISRNVAFPGVVRRSFGWGSASNEPLGLDPLKFHVDSLPTTHETQLKIVEACQSRCLEYREMIRNLAESILKHTNHFEPSSVNAMAFLYQDFVQLKANYSDFKNMCAKGPGDGRAVSLSNEMTLFVQNLCLNTMQMQNEVYLERLETGFALIRAYCKLFRFMDSCSCFIRG